MVRGIESFRDWFRGYDEQYAIIGGTACDLLILNNWEFVEEGRKLTFWIS